MISRQSLENIVNTVPDPIFVKDREHRFVLLNDACCELIGHPREMLIGKSDYDFFPKSEADVFWEKDELVFKTGEENLNQEQFTNSRGVEHTIITKKRLFVDGKDKFIVGTIRNITEMKRIQKSLKETEEMYRQILDAITDLVLCKGPESKIFWANKAFRDYYGMNNEELRDIIDSPINKPDYTKQYIKDDAQVFSSGKTLNISEEPVIRWDGEKRFFHTVKSPIFDPDGKVKWTVGVSRDITEKKKSEDTLIRQAIDLAKSEAEKEHLEFFAYVAAHDLREPLQRIIGFADLLYAKGAGHLQEDEKKYIEKIQSSSTRMSQIIEDILKFAKVVKRQEFFKEVELKKIFDDVLSDLDFLIQKNKTTVEVGPMPQILGDEGQLRQLFQNLLANALKFRKEGKELRIGIRSKGTDDGFWEIVIEDDGIGFDPKDAARIFRPFERLFQSEKYQGSGVGLSICQKIVTHHYGKISADSQVGKGSKFYVYLPKSNKD